MSSTLERYRLYRGLDREERSEIESGQAFHNGRLVAHKYKFVDLLKEVDFEGTKPGYFHIWDSLKKEWKTVEDLKMVHWEMGKAEREAKEASEREEQTKRELSEMQAARADELIEEQKNKKRIEELEKKQGGKLKKVAVKQRKGKD